MERIYILLRGARRLAAGTVCAALLWAGAASAQEVKGASGAAASSPGASSAPQAKTDSAADWRAAWKKKWNGDRKAHTEAWRAEWRKEWAKQAKLAAQPSSLKPVPATQAAPKPEPKPEIKPEIKAAAKTPSASVNVAPVSAPKPALKPAPASIAAPAVPPKSAAPPANAAPANSATKNVSAPPANVSGPAAVAAPAAKSSAPAPLCNAALPVPAAAEKSAASKPAENALTETRPDPAAEMKKPADKPLDSPMGAIGDGGRMFFCLIPTVLIMAGALHLLRRFQEKNGRLPAFARLGTGTKSIAKPAPTPPKAGLLQGLFGGMNRSAATERGSIRVIESVPVGGSNLHLIEVRGRTLLLGASASGVNLLTEVEEADPLVNNEFRLLLEQAAGDMDSLDLPDDALPASLLVGTLDDPLRDANRAITRGTRRLRTVQETEAAWEREEK